MMDDGMMMMTAKQQKVDKWNFIEMTLLL